MAVLGQSGAKATPEDTRRAADELLQRAKAAMDEGNLEIAESFIARAEALKPQYPAMHFGDTPRKLRQELDKRKRMAKAAGAVPPSKGATPETLPAAGAEAQRAPARTGPNDAQIDAAANKATGGQTVQNPWATPGDNPFGRESSAVAADRGAEPSLPSRGPVDPAARATDAANKAADALARHPENTLVRQPDPHAGTTANPARAQSDSLLLTARRALATGDIRRATASLEQAKQVQIEYGPGDDSPDKIESMIRRHIDVVKAGPNGANSDVIRRQYAELLMEESQGLMRYKDLNEAERLAQDAARLGVPFGPYENKPATLLEKIAAARAQQGPQGKVNLAGGAAAATNLPAGKYPGAQALYDPKGDATHNIVVNQEELPPVMDDNAIIPGNEPQRFNTDGQPMPSPSSRGLGQRLFQQGEEALKAGDPDAALRLFQQAYSHKNELDPGTAQSLQDHLQFLSSPQRSAGGRNGDSLLQGTVSKQQLLVKQLSTEVAHRQTEARAIMEKEPKKSLEMLQNAKQLVESSELDQAPRDQLLRRIDLSVAEIGKYVDEHRAQIELDDANKAVLTEIDRERKVKVEVQQKLADLVNEFNKLMDEGRYAEAEVLAKKARELDRDNPVVQQLVLQSKLVSRFRSATDIRDAKEEGFVKTLENVDRSAIPFDDNDPFRYPDVKDWKRLTAARSKGLDGGGPRRTQREIEIDQRLGTPVSFKFKERPLAEVLDHIGKMSQINIFLDPQGLTAEGVGSDTPVTIDLTQDISAKSALNLILEPLHLSYVIKDEVLKVTSEQLRDGSMYTKTYYVADLLVPIPNFVANGDVGMGSALRAGYAKAYANNPGASGMVVANVGENGNTVNAKVNPSLLAQMRAAGAAGGLQMPHNGPVSGSQQPIGFAGPGGLGGGGQADFDTLIDLITSTVKPTSWDNVGGAGSIKGFDTNLSLVVSQTQEVHEEIADLLKQLRQLQDLQVTIEVRFITLRDNFFERIGVDFDFNIVSNGTTQPPLGGGVPNSETVGLSNGVSPPPVQNGTVSAPVTQNIPFRQDSFVDAVPQFGGFTTNTAAQMGFAILSDIEAYFFIQAAQGDTRTNLLQAPKVTLFNGQQAFITDSTQRPFVTGVIPVVGDFAVAQQPVVMVLSEGTSLTVQAVVSSDRRFVRLTVVPFFSQITSVDTFTFNGTTTSTKKKSTSTVEADGSTSNEDDTTDIVEGTTVQLPSFAVVAVATTVSVPDGGTVLLGGVKRLSEGRNERGVPILSKIPYINRLFKNVGIGRETSSLMMMVTPHIIIQEEEEEKLLGTSTGSAAP